jgi:hypothetical protein
MSVVSLDVQVDRVHWLSIGEQHALTMCCVNDEGRAPTHVDVTAAFDNALHYSEQCSTTPVYLLLLNRWRNITFSNRFSSLRQNDNDTHDLPFEKLET